MKIEVELVDILDDGGNKTGNVCAKETAHEKKFWHAGVDIWIYNQRGEVLLRRRALNKKSWPGFWDTSVSGHVRAGEEPMAAAVRELREELGLRLCSDQLIGAGMRPEIFNLPSCNFRQFVWTYLYCYDKDVTLPFDQAEVAECRFWNLEELMAVLTDERARQKFVPHALEYYFDAIKLVQSAYKNKTAG